MASSTRASARIATLSGPFVAARSDLTRSLLVVSTIDGMLLLGANVMLAQEIQSVFTPDALSAGVILLPYLVGTVAMCLPAA